MLIAMIVIACSCSCLLFISVKASATLTAGPTTISVGGNVTLTCSVQNSDGWKYYWYRRTQVTTSVPVDPVRVDDEQKRVIRVSQGGIYWCLGRRGKPVYDTISISNDVVLTQQPHWPQLFSGETITLTCEVHGGGTTEWVYEWRGHGSYVPWTDNNYQTFGVSESSSGDYMCRSRPRDDSYSSTQWSKAVTLSVSEAKAVLTVSPSWLSPGASVTLSCQVEHPSAGWRFYWYKLLPGSSNGTEEDSYIVDGQTQTAGYACRAGRGDPVHYTDESEPQFVWSGGQFTCLFIALFPFLLISSLNVMIVVTQRPFHHIQASDQT
uniref:Ig-like domain-containing protein n=1 Tax=Stegastes partitus TaxID=144197 RepID=A0A3B4ZU66_9TELE